MKKQHRKKGAFASMLGSIVLVSLGLALALGLVEMFLRTFPNWVPSEVRVNPPARRVKAFINETYDVKLSDGDLFHHMQGKITPLLPDEDRVLTSVHMITDANGFRNSSPEKAIYDIVALGDSFTRASGVGVSWPQKLAELTGMDVLNLGDVGFGPQEELKVLQRYGLKKQPRWIIMAYFEGNDLYDVGSYEQANPFIVFRFGRYMLDQGIDAWRDRRAGAVQAEVPSAYQYPISIRVNNRDLEMAFFSHYIGWISTDREAIEASKNFRLLKETILQVQALCEAEKAHFLLVYMPSKEHIYLPYLNDTDTLERVFADVPTVKLDEAGFLQFTNKRAIPELTRQHMDDQAELLADFAAEHKILFLDLTSTYQKEAGKGAELYYSFDTHSNQNGQDLAAETISEYIQIH